MQASTVFDLIHDGDGLVWQVILSQHLAPALKRADKVVWHVRMHAEAKVTGASLAASGVLDRVNDSRLLGLLGDEPVILRSGDVKFEAAEEKQIPRSAVEATSGIKNTLSSKAVKAIKVLAVIRQVECLSAF